MSVSQEYRLGQSLVWSNQEFSLADFVKRYELPQVVLVLGGYCGDTERTTFGRNQVLTLHTLRTTSKIVCQVPHSNAVVVPTSCPLKAEVIPMDCRDTKVTAYQLSTTYQKIKYVRVMEVGSTWNNNSIDTLKINDILQIKKIDSKNSVIRCKNLTTAQDVSIYIDSTAVFVPLLDSNTYNLAEIQKKFGLPAKVRFLDKRAEIQMRSVPGKRKPSTSSTYLSDLGQMTAIEETQESDVIVTTVCSNLEEKVCLNVPTTLDITITVAEGFLRGDKTYQRVVKTLDKQLNRTNLKAFDDLDVYEHMNAVKKRMEEMVFIEEASTEVVERAREHLQRVERKKSKKLSSFEMPPNHPPRQQESAKQKAPPERLSIAGQKSKQNKTDKKTQNIKLKSPYSTVGWKQSSNKTPSNESFSRGHKYEKPTDQPGGDYEYIDDIYEETESQNSYSEDNNYTKLDTTYTPVNPRLYEKYITEAHKAKETTSLPSTSQTIKPPPPLPIKPPPPLPIKPPAQTQEDKQAIYEAISRFPQDLSGLGVADVSRLLGHLNLSDYVQTFANELIDGTMLVSMDQESLESLGVKPFHCKKLLDFIAGWRPRA